MNTHERWIKWEPIKGIKEVYSVEEVTDTIKGFKIILSEWENEKSKIKIFYKDSVNAYRTCEESYRINIKDFFTQPDGKNLYGIWPFFKVENSSYLKWLEKESCGFFPSKHFTHFAIVGENQIIDIATIGDPIIEHIK